MGESSSEMSAEKMTEAMSLDEKPEASSFSAPKPDDGRATSFQEKSEEATSSDESPDQADSAENTDEADDSEQPDEANAQPCKFIEKDPLDLVPYIEKYMSVKLEKNYTYVGFVHSIDPITHR